jgi:hypothetical protein
MMRLAYSIRHSSSYLLLFLACMLLGMGSAWGQKKKGGVKVEGTGRTTGHVVSIEVDNPSDVAMDLIFGPYLIPATGNYQGYLIPDLVEVTVPPGETMIVRLDGYCTDIHRRAVPAGEPMVDFDEWIERSNEPFTLAVGDHPGMEYLGGVPLGGTFLDVRLTYPGTNSFFPYTLDINEYPEQAAPQLFDAMDRIRESYEAMKRDELITTPFSNTPEKEEESVIQHTFWIYTSALTGDEYKIEDFEHNLINEFERQTGQEFENLPTSAQEDLEGGVDQFWTTFTSLGEGAKIFSDAEMLKQNRDEQEFERLRDVVRDEDGEIDEDALEDLVEFLGLELLDEAWDDFADLGLGSAIGAAITLANMPEEVCNMIRYLRDAVQARSDAERTAAASEYIRAWKNAAGLPSISSVSAGTNNLKEAIEGMSRQQRIRAARALNRTYHRVCR